MRVELTRPIGHYPLKVARLPIPPPGQRGFKPGATDGTRTRDLDLGKVALYQLSYCRKNVFQRTGATDGTRTRDLDLGKVALYQLSYCRKKVQPCVVF